MQGSTRPRAYASPRVSVILPVYNRSHSLRASAESVLYQDFRDLELIIVDDASTEDLKPIVDELHDDRVVFVQHETNGGVSRARNTGMMRARGEYISFQDSDDLWLPGRLTRQVALLDEHPPSVGAVIGTKILYGRDQRHNYGPGRVTCAPLPEGKLNLSENQEWRFLRGNRISLQNALFRRDCLPDQEWFDPCAKANADQEFSARLAQHTKILEEYEPVVLAFISSDSISTNRRKKILGLLRILKKNRSALARYRDAHALLLLQVARHMRQLGKRKLAWRFIAGALQADARTVLGASGLGKTFRRRLR